MVNETKKRILISEELKESPVGAFFQEINFELDTSFEINFQAEYCFIINDYCPDLLTIPRLKLDPTVTYEDKIEKQVRASIAQSDIDDPNVKSLIKSFLTKDDFELIENYSDEFKSITSIKIHEYLNVGYFIDTIVVEAYKNGFDYDCIRRYLNQVFEYAFSMIEGKKGSSILDVLYSFTGNVFAVDVSWQSLDFKLEKDFDSRNEFLSDIIEHTNYFHLNYFTKRSKLSLSSAWFKGAGANKFKSYFLSETTHKIGSANSEIPLVLGIEEKEQVIYTPRTREADEEGIQARKLSLCRKFALFIKNYRASEVDAKELMSLDIGDIDQYLTYYPRQESLKDIDDEIRNFILKLVQDEKLFDGIGKFVQSIADSNLTPHVENIKRLLSGKSLADLDEIIRIKGVTSVSRDDSELVKGWTPNEDSEEVRIEGVTDNLSNDEKWELTRNKLAGKIQDELVRIKSQGGNIIQDDIIRVVSNELHLPIDDVAVVVKEITEEAIARELTQTSKLEDAFALKFIGTQADRVAKQVSDEKLEKYVLRMKKVMAQMKDEMIKLRAEVEDNKKQSAGPTIIADQSLEILELQTNLNHSLEALRNKEKMFAKSKSDFEQILESKERKIHILEDRIEEIKGEFSRSTEFANEEKIEQLNSENKSLSMRLELANRKINIISDNMAKQESGANVKKDKEISTLKANMQMAQALIEKLKQERNDLVTKLAEEKEKSASMRDGKGSASGLSQEEIEKDPQFMTLFTEKKILEEKLRAQGTELKKQEQKLKFSIAQLEESQRKRSSQSAAKGNDIHFKQLESTKSRLNEMSVDLVEKKKEIIKLKQDNNILSAKVGELEKKLGNMEKKSA